MHVLAGGQDTFKPGQQSGQIGPRLFQGEARDLDQLVITQVVDPPVGSIGQDSDIALPGLFTAGPHVTSELPHGVLKRRGAPQVLLDLNDGEPDLDVDAAATRDRRFQVHRQIVVGEVQATAEKQEPHVCLYYRLSAGLLPVRKTSQGRREFVLKYRISYHVRLSITEEWGAAVHP